jgi:hypothetical protein
VLVFEGEVADEGDDFVAEQFGLVTLLQVILAVVEYDQQCPEEEGVAFDYFLGVNRGTCAKEMLTWNITLRLLKI